MEREQLDVDVLFVGAGPASLSASLHLSNLCRRHDEAIAEGRAEGRQLGEMTFLVVEKGREIGSHGLSGAVIDPAAFVELLSGMDVGEPPWDSPVAEEGVYFLSERRALRSPVTPPPLRNHGYYVASLGKVVRWLAEVCIEQGVEVYPEFPAASLLFEGDRVVGARMGDRGVGHDGRPNANFEPGIDVKARVTVLGEGPRGTLTGEVVRKLQLDKDSQPEIYAIGVKEIWQLARDVRPGVVYHTLGFPLGTRELGGGFIYTMQDNLVDIGFVTGIDSKDPRTDGHLMLQKYKTHPWVRALLKGGKCVSYGAKAIPEGGYYAMPRLYGDGFLIVGDSGGFLNAQRLKGIHLAVKSGILAAESIFEALVAERHDAGQLSSYAAAVEASWARDELWKVRNFRQSFQGGFYRGMMHAALQFVSGGRGLFDPFPTRAGHERMKKLSECSRPPETFEFDGRLTLDKPGDVYLSDTAHEEDQPAHLKILDPDVCDTRCGEEYGYPCQHFCPASVYEILSEGEQGRLRINFSNCVHCKTCEIADPYQVIRWTTPEGGGGPDWKNM